MKTVPKDEIEGSDYSHKGEDINIEEAINIDKELMHSRRQLSDATIAMSVVTVLNMIFFLNKY